MGGTVVLHPGALGDVLLAVPALRALRAKAANAALMLAAQPRIGRLLAALGIVDRDVAFDSLGLEALFADDPPPERVHRFLEGTRVVSWFGSKDPGFARRLSAIAPGAVVGSTVPCDGATVWEHLVASVVSRPADRTWRDTSVVPSVMAAEGRRALAEAGWDGARPFVMLHPGAGGLAKRWAVEAFAEVARALVSALGVDVVVHEGPADHEAVAALRSRLRAPTIELVEPPLEALAGAMHHAVLWLGNDSGVTHLAAAVGAPTLALFMASNLAWRPWAPDARVRVVTSAVASRLDVEAVVADALDLTRARSAHPAGAR